MSYDYPILYFVFQVKTRMMCLSLLSTWPSLRLTNVSPGLVHDIWIRESYTSLPLNLGKTYFKFLPSKKLITRHPLNQDPAATMVRHPAAHEEFLPSMSWISILRNLQLLASQSIDHPSLSSTSHVNHQKVIHQSFSYAPPLCHAAFLRTISHGSYILPHDWQPCINVSR